MFSKKSLVALTVLAALGSSAMADKPSDPCYSFDDYRSGMHEVVTIDLKFLGKMMFVSSYVRKHDGVDFKTAQGKIDPEIQRNQIKPLDDKINDLKERIDKTPSDSAKACQTRLGLKDELARTTDKKINLIIKALTGVDVSGDKPLPAVQ